MSKQTLVSSFGRIWILVLLLITTCYSLKCRTDDGLSEAELKRITRTCMRKIGEYMRPNSGGSAGSSSFSNSNHYGPLHQRSFGAQQGGNSRYDYTYDSDDDGEHYNDNNNNNNNDNYNHNNGNYERGDRADRGDNRNVLQQRNREHQQNNRDNNRSMSSGSYSSSNGNNNRGRHEQGNNSGGNGGGGNGNTGGNNNNDRNAGNSGAGNSNGNGGNNQRSHNQNNSNNNNNNKNNKNSSNDTVDAACIVHCFFEQMNMLNSYDYPDRYKVQYGLTRELRDRELRNFYTDTIQDCFHYIDSQRHRDKCHYSRDLINCMTEYAKVNCDDWQEFNMVFN